LDLFFSVYSGGNSWVISILSQGMDTQLQLTKIQYNQSVVFLLLRRKFKVLSINNQTDKFERYEIGKTKLF